MPLVSGEQSIVSEQPQVQGLFDCGNDTDWWQWCWLSFSCPLPTAYCLGKRMGEPKVFLKYAIPGKLNSMLRIRTVEIWALNRSTISWNWVEWKKALILLFVIVVTSIIFAVFAHKNGEDGSYTDEQKQKMQRADRIIYGLEFISALIFCIYQRRFVSTYYIGYNIAARSPRHRWISCSEDTL